MKGRYIGLVLLAWMIFILGLGLAHHSSSHKPKALPIPTGATDSSQTNPGSATTTPSFVGTNATPTVPGSIPGSPSPAPSVGGPTQQQNIAVSGWPAVASLPYRDKLIRVEFDLFAANKPHLSVYYTTTLAAGHRAFDSFLRRHHDRPGHYAVRYFSRAVVKQANAQQSQMNLAFDGYKLIVRLPDHYGKTNLSFAGKQGREVLIGYTGPRAAALKRLRYWARIYHDSIARYTLVRR